MSGYSTQRYPNRSEALEAVASHLGQVLESALANHHRVTFGVCGGRTAEALFPMLSELPLNWGSVDVLLIDERWVSSESAKSNEKLVRDALLQSHGAAATVVGLKTHHDCALEALDAVEQRLDQGLLPIDVLFVSMGDDGHIASLFPQGAENSETRRKVVASSSPLAPHERISLAPWVLKAAKRIILPIFDEKKQALFDKVTRQDPSTEYPVWHVLSHDDTRCEVFLAP